MTEPVRDPAGETQQGLAFHQAGNLAAAGTRYRRALAVDPAQFDALHLLGVAQMQQGRPGEAARFIGRALGLNPRLATAQSNLGNCLRGMSRPGEALARYDLALSIQPDFIDALNNRGNALQDLGRREEALASYRAVLTLLPDAASVFRNLANALVELERQEDALASYGRALAIGPGDVDTRIGQGAALLRLGHAAAALAIFEEGLSKQPDHLQALWLRGNALKELERFDEALRSFERALEIDPEYSDVLNNRGVVLLTLKRPEEALASFERMLDAVPAQPDALGNRGAALHTLRRWPDALASCHQALALDPAHVGALNNRANVLRELGDVGSALAAYARALAIKPSYADALANHGNALRTLGRYDEAIADFAALVGIDPGWPYAEGYLLHSQMNCCDWSGLDERAERISASVRLGRRACTPFSFFSITRSERDQASCAEAFCRDALPQAPAPLWRGERYDHDRIRIAYLSADFREHAIPYLLAGLFERHDRRRFETIALSFGPAEPSAMRTRLERSFERFIDVRNESDRDIAALVRRLEVDIAVDLMGHTHHNRLGVFAWRPAPVSVNFFCPTGASFIDYLFADPIAIPKDNRRFHREKIAYLPDSFLATDSTRRIAERTPPRAELGLPETAFVFCCFNNTYKINPTMFGIWMRLLREVDGSVLWLQQIQASATEALRREAAASGIDSARLVFAPRIPSMEEHLARYRQADLFLDTLPFNAQTTATDALWAGLPVLTCLGTTFVGRVAASLLHAIGLPELVTGSLADYEARALALARDGGALTAIRAKLARNRNTHPLFDTDRYRRHVESAYLRMWERAQRGAPPETFAVTPLT